MVTDARRREVALVDVRGAGDDSGCRCGSQGRTWPFPTTSKPTSQASTPTGDWTPPPFPRARSACSPSACSPRAAGSARASRCTCAARRHAVRRSEAGELMACRSPAIRRATLARPRRDHGARDRHLRSMPGRAARCAPNSDRCTATTWSRSPNRARREAAAIPSRAMPGCSRRPARARPTSRRSRWRPTHGGSGSDARWCSPCSTRPGRAGRSEVFLEVRADNPHARALYVSLGFEQIAVRAALLPAGRRRRADHAAGAVVNR